MSRKRRCLICEYEDPSGLVDTPLCRDHIAQLRGRSATVGHHILGRKNSDDVVKITENLHAYVTPILRDCERMMKESDADSPLLRLALADCSMGATAEWYAKHHRRSAAWSVALNSLLTERWGERWWEKSDLGPLYGEGNSIRDE